MVPRVMMQVKNGECLINGVGKVMSFEMASAALIALVV